MEQVNKRKHFTQNRKREILSELNAEGMTVSFLARKHGIHPITIHGWKRTLRQKDESNSSPEVVQKELLEENKKLRDENTSLFS